MELMTAAVLLSAIATIGFLANKYLDRKYGTKPNQELIDRLSHLESVHNDLVKSVDNKFKEVSNLILKNLQDFDKSDKDLAEFKKHTANLFVAIDKKLTGLHLGEILGDKHQEVFELK